MSADKYNQNFIWQCFAMIKANVHVIIVVSKLNWVLRKWMRRERLIVIGYVNRGLHKCCTVTIEAYDNELNGNKDEKFNS